jgi:cell division protein FtsL
MNETNLKSKKTGLVHRFARLNILAKIVTLLFTIILLIMAIYLIYTLAYLWRTKDMIIGTGGVSTTQNQVKPIQ